MPVVPEVKLTLEMRDVLRRVSGTHPRTTPPAILALTHELVQMVEEGDCLRPVFAYEILPIEEWGPDRLILADGRFFEGKMLAIRFHAASELAGAICTIGPRVDELAGEYHSRGDDLRALLLDGIGTAALDSLAREACHHIGIDAAERSLQAGGALSPGLHGLPLSDQDALLRLVHGERIGVSLTSGKMLVPAKSVSMLIGLGREVEGWSRAQACDWCNLRQSCAYRVTP